MKYLLTIVFLFCATLVRADGVYDVRVHTFPATADGYYSSDGTFSTITLGRQFLFEALEYSGGNFAIADEDVVGFRGHDVISFNGFTPYFYTEGNDMDLYIGQWDYAVAIASIYDYVPRHDFAVKPESKHTVVTPEPSTLTLMGIGFSLLAGATLMRRRINAQTS